MSNDRTDQGASLPETALPSAPMPVLAALPARLWLVLEGLRRAIAALGGRDRASVPLVRLAWTRVGRLAQRFEALVAHLLAGTLPAPRLRVTPRNGGPRVADGLPRGFGWLVRVLQEAASYGCQLQALLADPAMASLLQSCPRAGRIVRPLRHMLGIAEPGAPVRVSRPPRASRSASRPAPGPASWPASWPESWRAPPADGAAAPGEPVPFPTGRPPPSWFR